jgi:hypothetical protein
MVGPKFLAFRQEARIADWHRINHSVKADIFHPINTKYNLYRDTIRVKFKDNKIFEKSKSIQEISNDGKSVSS